MTAFVGTFFAPDYIFTVGIPLVGDILFFGAAVFAVIVMITKLKRAPDRKRNMIWLTLLIILGIVNGLICVFAM